MALMENNWNHKRWLAKRYGSRRGFVRTWWHRIHYLFGSYRSHSQIDWSSVERLVFVCKGNICRSAYAEAVARAQDVKTLSCGLETIENGSANKDAIRIAKTLGINLTNHKTQPIMNLLLEETDLLVVMEPWQAEFINKNLCRKPQCTLLGLWSQPISPHIQDPYGCESAYFERCFGYIQESVNELIKKIEKKP
jgi:protein-tyrosine phosphatase